MAVKWSKVCLDLARFKVLGWRWFVGVSNWRGHRSFVGAHNRPGPAVHAVAAHFWWLWIVGFYVHKRDKT